MTSRRRMEDSERRRAVGRIEAGHSIIDVALFFGVHHSVISRLWKQFQTTQTVVLRFLTSCSRVTTTTEDWYIAILARDPELEPEAGALWSHVFPGAGAGALNFSILQGSFLFFNMLLNLCFKNYINIQYFSYNRKNEWEIIQDLKTACKYK